MEDGIGKQLDLWTMLGTTADTLASGLRSTGAKGKSAEPEGPAKSGRIRQKALSTAGAVNSGTPYPRQGEAKGKARIVAAKHGNAFVVIRRRD